MDSQRLKNLDVSLSKTLPAAAPLPVDPVRALAEAQEKKRVKPIRGKKKSRRGQNRNSLGQELAKAIGGLEGTKSRARSADSPISGQLGGTNRLA
jgi:hypothetical protein